MLHSSLVYFAGLTAVPKVIQTAEPDGSLNDVPTVDSEDILFAGSNFLLCTTSR